MPDSEPDRLLARLTQSQVTELLQRVTELEVRSAYQDHLIAKLDGVVLEFTARTEALGRTISALEQRLAAAAEAGTIGPPDEKPPHY